MKKIQVMLVHRTKYIHIHRKFVFMSQIFNLYVLFVEVLDTLLRSNKYMDHNSIIIDSVLLKVKLVSPTDLKLHKDKSVFAKQHSILRFLLLKLYFIA